MDFKKTTDALFARIDHEDLADALGISVASIRQARLQPEAKAHRTPPEGWEKAALQLAEKRLLHYRRLIETLRKVSAKEAPYEK